MPLAPVGYSANGLSLDLTYVPVAATFNVQFSMYFVLLKPEEARQTMVFSNAQPSNM
jgi:hypothetical protein